MQDEIYSLPPCRRSAKRKNRSRAHIGSWPGKSMRVYCPVWKMFSQLEDTASSPSSKLMIVSVPSPHSISSKASSFAVMESSPGPPPTKSLPSFCENSLASIVSLPSPPKSTSLPPKPFTGPSFPGHESIQSLPSVRVDDPGRVVRKRSSCRLSSPAIMSLPSKLLSWLLPCRACICSRSLVPKIIPFSLVLKQGLAAQV